MEQTRHQKKRCYCQLNSFSCWGITVGAIALGMNSVNDSKSLGTQRSGISVEGKRRVENLKKFEEAKKKLKKIKKQSETKKKELEEKTSKSRL